MALPVIPLRVSLNLLFRIASLPCLQQSPQTEECQEKTGSHEGFCVLCNKRLLEGLHKEILIDVHHDLSAVQPVFGFSIDL